MIYLLLKFGSFLTHVCCFLTSSFQWKTLIIDRNVTVTFTVFSLFHKYTSKNNPHYLCGILCNKYVNIIIMFQIQIYVIVRIKKIIIDLSKCSFIQFTVKFVKKNIKIKSIITYRFWKSVSFCMKGINECQ